jgi:hypothetical protein
MAEQREPATDLATSVELFLLKPIAVPTIASAGIVSNPTGSGSDESIHMSHISTSRGQDDMEPTIEKEQRYGLYRFKYPDSPER